MELRIRTSLLRPHPDDPHVVPDHVGVQERVPVHLPHALFALTVQLYPFRAPTSFLSLFEVNDLFSASIKSVHKVKFRSELTTSYKR